MLASVEIVEVGPRDGLQNEPGVIETADKVALINRAIDYGARRIEVASFVNARRVPQMADGEAVIAALPDDKRVTYIGLCLNERGVERAIATREGGKRGIDEAGCVLVATDGFGIANQGQTVTEGIAANRAMIALAKGAGLCAQVTISASFGCPFDGEVPQARVLDLAEAMAEAGADEVAFADTIGVAVPAQVGEMFERAFERLGKDFPLRAHFHDTRGLAAANAWAAYLAGCRVFDSSLTYMFAHSGVETGINLGKALEANAWFADIMGRSLPSRVGQAGDFTVKKREAA
jgi:hydroxymethylglutaryl-CoA lyase